jgi:hypothetical protein
VRKRSRPIIALVPLAAVALSVVTNIATNNLPQKFRPPVWSIWLALALLAILVIVLEVRAAHRHSEIEVARGSKDVPLSTAAADLADAVRDQWRAEAATRSLTHPEPIRVRWSTTDRPVSAQPSSIIGSASPGRVIRLHLRGDVTQVVEMFTKLPRRQLVILGAPGAGKSVMALLFTLQLLADRKEDAPVPVLLSLSSWDPRKENLLSWIARRIHEDYPGIANASLYGENAPERLISNTKIIPVLDGLDEIPEDLRGAGVSGIGEAFGKDQPFVITCRAIEYQNAVEVAGHVLSFAAVVEILPIDTDQVISYLSSSGPVSQVRWQSVFAKLQQDPSGPLAAAFSTPLMVWLARIAYSQNGTKPEDLLDTNLFGSREAVEDHLLDEFIPAVYSARPQAPGDRGRLQVDPSDAEHWLRFIARSLSHNSRTARGSLAPGDQTDIAWWRMYQSVPPFELGLAAFLIVGPLAMIPLFLTLGIASELTARRSLAIGTCLGIVLSAGAVLAVRLSPPPPGRIQIRLPRRGRLPGNLRTGLIYGCGAAVTAALAAGLGTLELRGFDVALRFGVGCGCHHFLGRSI